MNVFQNAVTVGTPGAPTAEESQTMSQQQDLVDDIIAGEYDFDSVIDEIGRGGAASAELADVSRPVPAGEELLSSSMALVVQLLDLFVGDVEIEESDCC
jgi:hypothetical protein